MTYPPMTSEELEQFERDHEALDLASHQPSYPKEPKMDFLVTYQVSMSMERARELAADEGEDDFSDDPEGTTEVMIQNEIEGNNSDSYDITGQVKVDYKR